MLASSRLFCWVDLPKSAYLSGTLRFCLLSLAQDWGRDFKRDWIRGMSKLFTLYTVATGTPLEVEIGVTATLVA